MSLKKLGKIKHGRKLGNFGAPKFGIMEGQGAQAPSWIRTCDEVKFTESRKFIITFRKFFPQIVLHSSRLDVPFLNRKFVLGSFFVTGNYNPAICFTLRLRHS